jgi:DNA-directed RNA polymerase specialized sigma24 family protein
MNMTMIARTVALATSLETARMDGPRRLEALFDAHHQRLYRLARRLAASHDDARDLVQETYLRAAQKPGSVPIGASSEEACCERFVAIQARNRARKAPRSPAPNSDYGWHARRAIRLS